MNVLVTGGAGYIGSITVKRLLEQKHKVTAVDNLICGHREAVSCELLVGDLTDSNFLIKELGGRRFDAVIHFAAYALAGESMRQPYKYFRNNILGGLNLLEFMRKGSINKIIFSSTCAIFGTSKKLPLDEEQEKIPESVYGQSKLMYEQILEWYRKIYGINYINLRYFNASGAALDASLGEEHDPETHIIPLAIRAAVNNSEFQLFGKDYDTPDSTCMRDYIHVEDLAYAHILALERMNRVNTSSSFNLGVGKGYSNLEVLDMVRKISGKDFSIKIAPRRLGDPAMVYADNTKARTELGFEPKYSSLETIVKTAWEWHKTNSKFKIQNSK